MMRLIKKSAVIGLGLAVTTACVQAQAATHSIELTRTDQKQIDLTVYNDFAVIRDTRTAVLPKGVEDVVYSDVPQTIDPTSVRVTSIGHGGEFRVEQQIYQYDLLNKQSLLQRYIGKTLKYSRSVQSGDTYKQVLRDGTLLAINPEIVKFANAVEISPPGVISLPSVPKGLHTVPTLTWRVDNRVDGPQTIATSYLANGMSWSTDYRMDLNSKDTAGDLSVWVSVRNASGMDYHNASVQLIAGDVNHTVARPRPQMMQRSAMMSVESKAVAAQPFFDYYLYSIPGRVDLANNETRQFRLMSAENIPVVKSYRLTTVVAGNQLTGKLTGRFDVRLTFANRAKDGLGVPLPQGKFRVFTSASEGAPQLLGEDELAPRSKNEPVVVTVGKAFDLVAEHTQTSFHRVGTHVVEVGYRVDVHNHKQQKVTVTLDEKLPGDWTMINQSTPGKRVDSATQAYVLTLDPDSNQSFNYTARITD